MKIVRPLIQSFIVMAVMLQIPTASAETVSAITLPSGTWDVTATVTGNDAGNGLGFGFVFGESSTPVCPTGEEADCEVGDSRTVDGLSSGDLTFYLEDFSCEQTFFSDDPNHAVIDQTSSTRWVISWDDAGDCEFSDGDFNDLQTEIVAQAPFSSGGVDNASAPYTGNEAVTIQTSFGANDTFRSAITVPAGFEPGSIIDTEKPAAQFPNFCGGLICDAQVDVSSLPAGSHPNSPIKLYMYYKGTDRKGNKVYGQGDADNTSHRLLFCDSAGVARVAGDPAKCIVSFSSAHRVKRVIVNVPSGADPIFGKH